MDTESLDQAESPIADIKHRIMNAAINLPPDAKLAFLHSVYQFCIFRIQLEMERQAVPFSEIVTGEGND